MAEDFDKNTSGLAKRVTTPERLTDLKELGATSMTPLILFLLEKADDPNNPFSKDALNDALFTLESWMFRARVSGYLTSGALTTISSITILNTLKKSDSTDYDKQNKVEKSAVQLMDYEKTKLLAPGESQTIAMKIDLANLASYDANGAGTFILDAGDYYFAIGEDSHDALNNILAAQSQNVTGDAAKTFTWNWAELDAKTFAVSKTGAAIGNVLTTGDYSMDINSFPPSSRTT